MQHEPVRYKDGQWKVKGFGGMQQTMKARGTQAVRTLNDFAGLNTDPHLGWTRS
jgi:hypothetical protein